MNFSYQIRRKEFYRSTFCFAADRNLYITSNGNVIPCCYNRNIKYGNILTNELSEIINSKTRLNLMAKLKSNDFSMGCNYCKGAISSKNYKLLGSQYYDRLFTNLNIYPIFMEFELDTFCNLNCIMCPTDLHTNYPNNNFNETFIEKIDPLLTNLKWAKFYGGEPFIINIYYKIWERLIEINPGCIIKIQTNGTILNNSIKTMLEKGKFQISISIDSLNDENYNRIRKGAELNKTLDNLNYFIDYSKRKQIALDIAVCPITENIMDIPDIIRYCNNKSIYINFNLVENPKELSLKYLSSEYLLKIITVYNSINLPYKSIKSFHIKSHLKSFINQLKKWHLSAIENEKTATIRMSINNLINKLTSITELNKAKLMTVFPDKDRIIEIKETSLNKLNNIQGNDLNSFIKDSSNFEIQKRFEDIIKYGF